MRRYTVPHIHTGRLLAVVALFAFSSYLVTSLLTERARGQFLAEKVKTKTAELLSREAELTKMALKEQDLLAELVRKDREIKSITQSISTLKKSNSEKDESRAAAESVGKACERQLTEANDHLKKDIEKFQQEVATLTTAKSAAEQEMQNALAGLEVKRGLVTTVKASLEVETAAREKAEGALRTTEWQLKQCTSVQSSLQEQLQQTAKEARKAISARDIAMQEMERVASTHKASTGERGHEEDVLLEEPGGEHGSVHGHAEEDGVIEDVSIDEFGGSVEGARSEEVVTAEQKLLRSAEYKRQHPIDGGVMKREDHEASEQKEEVEDEDEEQEEGEDEDEDDEQTDKKHASNISRHRAEEI